MGLFGWMILISVVLNLVHMCASEITLFSKILVSRRETAGKLGFLSYSNVSPPTVNCADVFLL